MVELGKHQNPDGNITFQINISPADLILYADEKLISQVVINLLKNAIQAIGNQPDDASPFTLTAMNRKRL